MVVVLAERVVAVAAVAEVLAAAPEVADWVVLPVGTKVAAMVTEAKVGEVATWGRVGVEA